MGNATEHTHRPALKALLEALDKNIDAVNEPQRIECGAPDFVVTKSASDHPTIGYLEAKDISENLSEMERDSNRRNPASPGGRQLRRYRQSLPNLILTNYIEFRRYVDGDAVEGARLATETVDGLAFDSDGARAVRELLSAFFQHPIEPVASAEELAVRLARISHMIREVVARGFEQDHVSQNLRDLFDQSKKTLVPDLDFESFADMFAQTLAYGLFAARVNFRGPGPFRWQGASYHIPPTNPFIQQVFDLVTGPSLNQEPFVSFVDDLSQLLGTAEMDAVLADFGKHGVDEDPILHFYETFLSAYDPTERERRGVYYTPEPVISYIVRSVDYVLRECFGCPEGLADFGKTRYVDSQDILQEAHRVLVLDPACGTGSFLYAVVKHVRRHYRSTGQAGLWRSYVKNDLLPRLFGFELLMAAYAMAHLKLGMQFAALDLPESSRADWAYSFDDHERLRVYLTNTLEQSESEPGPHQLGLWRAFEDEASAANGIKRELPIMVVLGNPPYSGHSANESRKNGELTWIGQRIEDYKRVDGEPLRERNPKWLQDDYVKFIRFGQWRIQQSGSGILAFITNHAYLTNPTFRGMRQQLMNTFSDIYLLDLHGNANRSERAPDGGTDDNVFDIRQGVAIALFVKNPASTGPSRVRHADLWGTRKSKYERLSTTDLASTEWHRIEPTSPTYLFEPWDASLEDEYRRWPAITDVCPVNSVGIVTARDRLTIHWSSNEALGIVRDFATLSTEEARRKYSLGRDSNDWKVEWAQSDVNEAGIHPNLVKPILYRPFDTRFTYYTGTSRGFLCRPRQDVMRHMVEGNNLGLIVCRQQSERGQPWAHVGVTKSAIESCSISNKTREINYILPLYVYTPSLVDTDCDDGGTQRQPNFDSRFTDELEQRLGIPFDSQGRGELESTFVPEDVFHYIYATLHSPMYRHRYEQFLRTDFPRVPLPNDLRRFRLLAELGRRLTAAHLLDTSALRAVDLRFPIPGENVVEKGHPKYFAPGETPIGEQRPVTVGRVYLSRSVRPRSAEVGHQGQYFEGVEPDVWAFRIGGYQPMEKWLKDRKGEILDFNDLTHYRRMAAAIRETIRSMKEIDRVGVPLS
ncbi:MAG: N-6 DNA methylase [Chloroflexi bacterium]|nr:N-6 DNA methylase [Chloroflexota bacterium]